jgi:hypothetical protein
VGGDGGVLAPFPPSNPTRRRKRRRYLEMLDEEEGPFDAHRRY